MKSIHVQTGLLFASLLVGSTQPALSTELKFVDKDGQEVACGFVDKLTVTSALVTAKGTESCLAAPEPETAPTPTAAAHNLGTVETDSQKYKNVTDGAVVQLPLPATSVTIVSQPSLPGARASASGANAVYTAPSSDQITGDASDSFTYKITDASGNSSDPARVDVSVKWVEGVQTGDCISGAGIVCMGPTPYWPIFHEPENHPLEGNTTHVWSFIYEYEFTGRMGTTLSTGNKYLKISEIPGDTTEAGLDCWRNIGDYVYYEPVPGELLSYCDLTVGKQYYLNIKNVDNESTTYQLKGGT